MAVNDNRIIVGLDIGTTKVSTVIGELNGDGLLDIIGEGTVPSDGIKRGTVVNLEHTIHAIQQSVRAAERVAGVQVQEAYLSVSGSHIKAMTSHGLAAIRRNQQITQSDVERAIENAKAVPLDPNLELLHSLPQEYMVDGQEGIKNPVGMQGVRLEVDVHIVAGGSSSMANLRRCSQEAGIPVRAMALQAYASGLAVLEPAELDSSVVVVDIGGGSTDLGVFKHGNLIHSAILPLGGDHITADLAQILRLPTEEAERIKRKHGSAIPELADPDLSLEIILGGQVTKVSAFELARIIRPRVQEILSLARDEVDGALGPMELVARSVVLTGGASALLGVVEVGRDRFRLPTRLGGPVGISGLKDVVSSPAHATAVGLIRFGAQEGIRGYSGATRREPVIPEANFGAASVPVPESRGDAARNSQSGQERPRSADQASGKGLMDRVRDFFKDFF